MGLAMGVGQLSFKDHHGLIIIAATEKNTYKLTLSLYPYK